MLKPPHPVARLAYEMALKINPNNHALDGGRASSAMEKEAVTALARMIGWDTHLGHLCGGRTMANLEALWLERRLAAGGVGTTVATLGTTATGAVDPLAAILQLRDTHDFRIHVDAAYGGYFLLVSNLAAETRQAFERISEAASAVIDP